MEWISVNGNNLPPKPYNNVWKQYIVTCVLTHEVFFDSETEETIVTTALYDHNQKIWHIDGANCINALSYDDGTPMCGDYVTHWMPLPDPPKEGTHDTE